MLTKLKNFFFRIKYPFYKSRNVWSDKFIGYKFTWYDDIPEGGQKAFGKELSKDLRKALKKSKMLRKFRFTQIKEKYGTLRLYHNGASKEVMKVLEKYELLSMCYCIDCGRPVRFVTQGWVQFLCDDCFKTELKRVDFKDAKERKDYIKACRLTSNDIPEIELSDKGKVDLKEEFGIDFKKLWGLK